MKTLEGIEITNSSPHWITDEMVYNEYGRFCSEDNRVQRLCTELMAKEKSHERLSEVCGSDQYPPLAQRELQFLNKHREGRQKIKHVPMEQQRYCLMLEFAKGELKPSTYNLIFGYKLVTDQYLEKIK